MIYRKVTQSAYLYVSGTTHHQDKQNALYRIRDANKQRMKHKPYRGMYSDPDGYFEDRMKDIYRVFGG